MSRRVAFSQKQRPEPLLSVTFGISQQTPANLFQNCVTTSLFHRNISHSLRRGRCLRGNKTGAALFQVPRGRTKAKAAAGSWKTASSIPGTGGMYLAQAFRLPYGTFEFWSGDTEDILRKGLPFLYFKAFPSINTTHAAPGGEDGTATRSG